MNHKILHINSLDRVQHNITTQLYRYIKDNPNIKSLILGVSGGADSCLVAILAHEVCRGMDIKLIGRSLPMQSNRTNETERARKVGHLFCDEFLEHNLEVPFRDLVYSMREMHEQFESPLRQETSHEIIRYGNIKARLRMIYLYDLAAKNRGLVLSTDNFTEYLLGFWTLHGDVGDYGMIQNLWKTEVYNMLDSFHDNHVFSDMKAHALIAKECRDAVPTDGLGITESDLDQFGGITSYEEIDKTLIEMLNEGYSKFISQDEIPKVLSIYERTKFKRNNPCNISRETLMEGL